MNVRVYQLAFLGEPEYDSRATNDEIKELFASINAIWGCARIRWKLLSCQGQTIDLRENTPLGAVSQKRELRQLFGQISPVLPLVLRKRIWNVCLLNRFPVRSGGVYLPKTKTVFFAESSRQYRANAVTMAHELGHMLGLQHVEYEANLMNQDSLRDLQSMLNFSAGLAIPPLVEEQIANVRAQAELGPY